MKRLFTLLGVVIPLAALGGWLYMRKTEPPKTPFAKAKRETLISTLPTNGKVEPLEWAAVRIDRPGLVTRLPVKEGQWVSKDGVLAQLNAPDLQAQLDAALARVAQARADLANIERGGRKSELVEIDNSLARSRLDREAAQREYLALRRLEEKQAATRLEVEQAHGRLRQEEVEIESLERKRAALVGSTDHAVAQAKLKEAESEVELARRRMAESTIRAPLAGVVYSLPIRLGSYLNVGDLVASVGRLDRLRVRVYVDEPELGRVAAGLPVTITWDALPGKQWNGAVERLPAEVQPLGTRQVGEVLCTIENPGHELVPGTNVNAEIRSSIVPNALTIPKEALRRQSGVVGVFVLQHDTIAWHKVKVGVSSISRAQITEGLSDGDAVALSSELPLRDGQQVTPVYP